MNSTERSEDLEIERDLPTTEADIAILRRLQKHRQISFAESLKLMSALDLLPQEVSDRPLAKGWEPFTL